jgi:hypothetical protein
MAPFAGSAAAGLIAGIIALAYLAYFVRELKDRKLPRFAPAMMVGLLFGTTIAAGPIGQLVLHEDIWPYYLIGECLSFMPGATLVVYRYLAIV